MLIILTTRPPAFLKINRTVRQWWCCCCSCCWCCCCCCCSATKFSSFCPESFWTLLVKIETCQHRSTWYWLRIRSSSLVDQFFLPLFAARGLLYLEKSFEWLVFHQRPITALITCEQISEFWFVCNQHPNARLQAMSLVSLGSTSRRCPTFVHFRNYLTTVNKHD